jgi:hypothetical protein
MLLHSENESVNHLFFKCVVAKCIWGCVTDFLGIDIGSDYMSVASKWLEKNILCCKYHLSCCVERYLVDSKTGLVKCQASVEENCEVVAGMETIIHKEDGGDVEAVFFPGAIDQEPLKIISV